MSSKFSPTFFTKDSKVEEKSIVSYCILAFCINSESNKPLLSFDQNLVYFLLEKMPQRSKMESLSVIFGFSDYINKRFSAEETVLNIRQLFSASYFANQLINDDSDKYFSITTSLLVNLMNTINKRQELAPIIINSFIYFFSSLIKKIKTIKIEYKYLEILINAASYTNKCKMDETSRKYIITFLLTSFFAFPGDKGTESAIINLIKETTRILQSNISVEFNFTALSDHMIKLLVSDIDFETHVALFMLVSMITNKYANIADFVLDDDNIQSIISFISTAVSQSFIEPVANEALETEEKEFDGMKVISDTFESDVVYSPKKAQCTIMRYDQTVKFEAQILDILQSAIIKLCNATNNRVSTSIKMINMFLKDNYSFGAAFFAMNWIKLLPLTEEVLESLRPALQRIIQISYICFNEESLKTFCKQFIPYIIGGTRFSIDPFIPPLEVFKEASYKFLLTEDLLGLINICIFCNEQRFCFAFDVLEYNNVLADIIIKHHKAAATQNNKRIEENRKLFFSFLQTICSIEKISNSLIRTPHFIESMTQLAFETKCAPIAYYFINQVALNLSRNDKSLLFLFSFAEKVFQEGPQEICTKILDIFVDAYKKNNVELTSILMQTQFVQKLIIFSRRFPAENKRVLSILDECNDERITKLFSPLSSILTESEADKLAETLFENNLKISTAVFGIVFDSYGPQKKKEFLDKLLKCCKESEKMTIAVNSSNLTTKAIQCLSEYRSKYERDELFDTLCEFISYISETSLRSSDLILLIQTMSSLPGNFRPFFTIDVLKILQKCFESKYTSPTSLFKLNGSPMLLPNVILKNPMTDFTFFCEIKFRCDNGNILKLVDTNRSEFSFDLVNNRIGITQQSRMQMKGVFNGEFLQRKWYKIAIVFSRGLFTLYANGAKQANLQGSPMMLVNSIVTSGIGANLKADIGTIGLCTVPLSDQEIELLYHFPSIPCTFAPYESRDFNPVFSQLFSGRIFLSSVYLFNASLIKDEYAINMAPSANPTVLKLKCQTYSFPVKPKDALSYIGGITTILPLFAQLDQPIAPKPGEEVTYEYEKNFLPTLLDILKVLLERSSKNQQEFYTCDGFKVISYLLSKSKLVHLSKEVITKFKSVFDVIYIPQLAAQMLNFIYFNPQIWIYLPLETQLFLFQNVLEIFQNLSQEKKVWFATVIPFSKILCIMRVCYWSNITDPQVCLMHSPKIDPTTNEVEAERPAEHMPKLRNILWIIANKIADVRFTLSDASTLCFFSFDLKDIDLTIATLSFLLKFLYTRPEIILPALSTNFKFSSFFPLFISSNQKLRGQCVHLFMKCVMLPIESRKVFLNPYTIEEWINIIICTISNENTTTLLPDLVFGYLFGLYDKNVLSVMPKIRISKSNELQSLTFACPQLLPLCLMLISTMNDEMCSKYIQTIVYTVQQQSTILFNTKNWDDPFLIFIFSRIKGTEMDNSTNICINTLLLLYIQAAQTDEKIFQKMINTIILISAITGNDYTFMRKHLISLLIKKEFFNMYKDNRKIIDMINELCFSYLFIIPSCDSFFAANFNNENVLIELNENNFSYQELYNKMLSTSIPQISFEYATRTTMEGKWEDAEFAEDVLNLMKQSALSSTDFFNFSFIVGIGLQHIDHFMTFSKYIRDVTSLLSPTNFKNDDVLALTNYMGGLIKVYLKTDMSHQSHIYLQEDTSSLADLLDFGFRQRMNWGDSLSSFDSCFIATGHNYAHDILERYAIVEKRIQKYAQNKELKFKKYIQQICENNKKYTTYLARLNQEDSSRRLDVRSEQIRFQMLQYASNVRNAFARGKKLYTKIWRTVGQDNGAWASPELNPVKHWKLSNILTYNYRRGIMTRNFQFDDHKNASILRDVGNPDNAAELYKKYVTKMRVTELGSENSIVSIAPDDKKIAIKEENENEFILKVDAKMISTKKVYSGSLILYNDLTVFESSGIDTKVVHIKNRKIKAIFTRKYLLLDTALEMYSDHQSHLFDFNGKERDEVLNFFSNIPTVKFIQRSDEDIYRLVQKATDKWRAGKISNFDYLMKLNVLAGRSYNDLSKYPVFPWVIKDYESERLDLDNPDTFRDLSKPIGAIEGERFNILKERMDSTENEEEKYLYGSFYSSAAVVIGYLIRMEPFTSLHIDLQSGRFDITERLFNSIPKAWESVSTLAMDYRELIPEFFYLPDFLINHNNFDLGKDCNDVALPPWATDAQDFVAKNAAALESPIATAALPRWIDLIFGCLSRGEGALEANNVYCSRFFDSIVTEEVLKDNETLGFLREYAACFGQASQQLFFEPHKGRSSPIRMFPAKNFNLLIKCKSPILNIYANDSIITVIEANYLCTTFDEKFNIIASVVLPHQAFIESKDISKASKCISTNKSVTILSQPWNSTFAKISVGTGEVSSIRRVHTHPITCVSYDPPYIASASEDCTVTLQKGDETSMTLTKHRSTVTCVYINKRSDAMITASIDGLIIQSSLSRTKEMHTTTIDGEPLFVSSADNGYITVVYFSKGFHLARFDANLSNMKETKLSNAVDAMISIFTPDGNTYAILSVKGTGTLIYNVITLEKVVTYDYEATAFAYDEHTGVLIRGNDEGQISGIRLRK